MCEKWLIIYELNVIFFLDLLNKINKNGKKSIIIIKIKILNSYNIFNNRKYILKDINNKIFV